MKLVVLVLLVYTLGAMSFPIFVWLLGYHARMRRQLINRVLGGGR
jgi:hypothetical protein